MFWSKVVRPSETTGETVPSFTSRPDWWEFEEVEGEIPFSVNTHNQGQVTAVPGEHYIGKRIRDGAREVRTKKEMREFYVPEGGDAREMIEGNVERGPGDPEETKIDD